MESQPRPDGIVDTYIVIDDRRERGEAVPFLSGLRADGAARISVVSAMELGPLQRPHVGGPVRPLPVRPAGEAR
jgi:hypothetical protein